MSFAGQMVVVTGGLGALGAAVVNLIAQQGASVVVPSHLDGPKAWLEALERLLDKETRERVKSGKPMTIPQRQDAGAIEIVPGVDLADEKAVEALYAKLPSCWASLHVAGGFTMAPIDKTTKGDFLKMMETNALTAFLCCREAVKKMRVGGKGGRIVNVAAKAAVVPAGGMAAYAMSKAAVSSLTQSLAEEVAGEGIWVNAVLPSIMDTPANRASFPPGTDFSKWPSVAEVAQTVVFLASAENRVTRGGLVPVYGRS